MNNVASLVAIFFSLSPRAAALVADAFRVEALSTMACGIVRRPSECTLEGNTAFAECLEAGILDTASTACMWIERDVILHSAPVRADVHEKILSILRVVNDERIAAINETVHFYELRDRARRAAEVAA